MPSSVRTCVFCLRPESEGLGFPVVPKRLLEAVELRSQNVPTRGASVSGSSKRPGCSGRTGWSVSAADIASRAEVGVGTLYRRFGTKEALIIDVVVDSFEELQVELDVAVADEDAWRGFVAFVTAHTITS